MNEMIIGLVMSLCANIAPAPGTAGASGFDKISCYQKFANCYLIKQASEKARLKKCEESTAKAVQSARKDNDRKSVDKTLALHEQVDPGSFVKKCLEEDGGGAFLLDKPQETLSWCLLQ